MGIEDYPRVEMKSRAAWRAWLEKNHASSGPIWLATWKKNTPHYMSYADIVEEALCFGWIDSTARSLDAQRSMLMLAPRKPKSVWSALNKKRIEELEKSGLMTDAGRAKIEAAKANGSWTALDRVEALEMPPDLAKALRKKGRETYDSWAPFLRKQALYWVSQAKRPETRAKRIAEIAEAANKGERPARWS
jgi:uncharacterized protein YdeI (YjbR/CyaY-like superfamily)